LQRAHFLAQCAHESGEFKWREEFASGSAYEGRKDLGNTQPGDGVRFKGRGFVQITGRANYKQFSKYCGEDLTANPTALATKYAADTATWFWQTRKLNAYAVDDSLASIKAITRRINGGFNGLQDRVNRFADYWAILKDNPNAFT
jgi:putative chitinase